MLPQNPAVKSLHGAQNMAVACNSISPSSQGILRIAKPSKGFLFSLPLSLKLHFATVSNFGFAPFVSVNGICV